MLRLGLVDDHPVARSGVEKFLDGEADLVLVSSVADPGELPRDSAGALDLDVLVMDLYLANDEPAVKLIAQLAGSAPILVMSASRSPIDVLAAIQMGAAGFLTKAASRESFLTAVRSVHAGGFYLSPQLADLIQAAVGSRAEPPGRPELSPREQDALSYIARGFTHQQTATRMGVSKATVDTYVARIRAKLQVGNKAELALAALRYVEWRRASLAGDQLR